MFVEISCPSRSGKYKTQSEQGQIKEVFVKSGQKVHSGEKLIEVEFSNCILDVVSEDNGYIKDISVEKGEFVSEDKSVLYSLSLRVQPPIRSKITKVCLSNWKWFLFGVLLSLLTKTLVKQLPLSI